METKKYIHLHDLEIYQLARELSRLSWTIYENMNWQDKKNMGDQFISSIDSIGANIAEGYGRFYYLDKLRFFYNSRGSMLESITHWLELLLERKKIRQSEFDEIKSVSEALGPKLNNYISSTYQAKNNQH